MIDLTFIVTTTDKSAADYSSTSGHYIGVWSGYNGTTSQHLRPVWQRRGFRGDVVFLEDALGFGGFHLGATPIWICFTLHLVATQTFPLSVCEAI